MRPKAQLHEVLKMRFLDVYGRFGRKELSVEEAVALLGISRSTFYRMRMRYQECGEDGLLDHRIGKPSSRRIPVDQQMAISELYKCKYTGWTIKHFHEKLEDHGFKLSYTSTKNILQNHGVVQKAPKRGKHRRKRQPKSMRGMMLHQDGSTHEWVSGKFWDLIVTMDDATNEIYSMFFACKKAQPAHSGGCPKRSKRMGYPVPCTLTEAHIIFIRQKQGKKFQRKI